MKIIHLSDLHFGTEKPGAVTLLEEEITEIAPDLIIISGDFTQIASVAEFETAQRFLRALPAPYLCVPGNHDIPAHNLLERFLHPYRRYRRYIQQKLCPAWQNDQIVIYGLNSARRALPHWNWANGAISAAQRRELAQAFDPQDKRWRLCTFHHPIHKVDEMPLDVTVFGRKRTIQTLQAQKVDIVLTGHVHHASITTLGDSEHQTVYISASTALSSRTRGQENGFNLITLDEQAMTIDIYKLTIGDFEKNQSYHIKKGR